MINWLIVPKEVNGCHILSMQRRKFNQKHKNQDIGVKQTICAHYLVRFFTTDDG